MKTKEKYRIIVMIGAAVILLFAILYFATYKETDILNVSTDEIKSIYVTNGLNGDMVDVPSSDFCDFANALNEVKLKKGRKVDSTGWDYGILLFPFWYIILYQEGFLFSLTFLILSLIIRHKFMQSGA